MLHRHVAVCTVATTGGEATARELTLGCMGVATTSGEATTRELALGHSKRCCDG